MRILTRTFFQRDTIEVARDLIGAILVRRVNHTIRLVGMITETEGYKGEDDPASHAYRGKTKRNIAMFGPVGHAYVYFVYGNYYCFNIVARASSAHAGTVLVRAIEPFIGIEHMMKLRKKTSFKKLTNGPGKLTQALSINHMHNGIDLLDKKSVLYVIKNTRVDSSMICASSRIGITKGVNLPWRFNYEGGILHERKNSNYDGSPNFI